MPPKTPSRDIDIKVGVATPLEELEKRRAIEAELARLAQEDPRALVLRLAQLGYMDEARQRLDHFIAEFESKYGKLKQQLEEIQKPPLRDGVYLKPSPDDPEKGAIVGIGGGRMEVQLAVKPPARPQELSGCEVWVNSENQIVRFREAYVRGEAAEVIEALGDDRLRVKGQGNDEILVERLPNLKGQIIESGDTVRIHPGLGVAFEKLAEKGKKALEPERIPDVRYEQVGGLDHQIQEIREAIEDPFLHRQVFRQYGLKRPKGILLHGPPGCGKTMVAKAIANSLSLEIRGRLALNVEALELFAEKRNHAELVPGYFQWRKKLRPADQSELPAGSDLDWPKCREFVRDYLAAQGIRLDSVDHELERLRKAANEQGRGYFLTINGPELLNKYVGETEYSIRRIFTLARKKATPDTPVVIFFDELESMFSRRGSHVSSDMESTVVPQLLSEIDGMDELSDVVIIGASNRYDLIDPAVLRPGRLDLKIYVGRPGQKAAAAILGKYLTPDLPLAATTLKDRGGAEQAVASLIERAVAVLYSPNSFLQIYEKADRNETMNREHRRPRQARKPVSEILSGAMLDGIVTRAKRFAVRREIAQGRGERGLLWQADLLEAIRAECEESKEQYVSEIRTSRDIADMEKYAVEVHLDEVPEAAPGLRNIRWFKGKARAWQAAA